MCINTKKNEKRLREFLVFGDHSNKIECVNAKNVVIIIQNSDFTE